MRVLPALFHYVKFRSGILNIDESHAVGHSMNVLHHAHNIYINSLHMYPILKEQEPIIYTSSIIHDMCDGKYTNVTDGLRNIHEFLNYKMPIKDIHVIEDIITKMSYSYVKQHGFPELGKYQMAYHIVREADLLSSYDMNRAIIYKMYDGLTVEASMIDSYNLFNNRVLKYLDDGLFITDYSKRKAEEMQQEAIQQMKSWDRIKDCFDKNCIYDSL